MLIAESRLEPALHAVVQRACEMARTRPVPWKDPAALPAGSRPALVISGLGSGERVIDDELVALMTRIRPGLSLLMLCADELIRPTLSLQGGRVTLLGPPLTEERVAARLRILLADARADSSVGTVRYGNPSAGEVLVHEHSTRRAYLAVASAGATEPEGQASLTPLLDITSDRSSALLSASGQLDASRLTQAAEQLLGDDSEEEKEKQLNDLFGPGAALVQLTAVDWSFYWPDPSSGLFLASPLRLPQVWSFANSLGRTDTTFLRAPAAPSDVLVALWGAPWPLGPHANRRDDEAELLNAAISGGPQVLDLLVERLKQTTVPAAGLVVEVR